MRFGIGGATDHTLEEIGKEFGVTRERIRGLALGGWWPVPFALLDAVSVAFSVTLLAFVCVLAVQVFGDIAVHFAGDERARIIHLAQVFKSLQTRLPSRSGNVVSQRPPPLVSGPP